MGPLRDGIDCIFNYKPMNLLSNQNMNFRSVTSDVGSPPERSSFKGKLDSPYQIRHVFCLSSVLEEKGKIDVNLNRP